MVRLFQIPMNYTDVLKRNAGVMQKSGATGERRVVLTYENFLWFADVFIEVAEDVPGTSMAKISGTFLTKAFEGPYRHLSRWTRIMKSAVRARGKVMRKLFVYYPTCPACAKQYGKNHVILFALL